MSLMKCSPSSRFAKVIFAALLPLAAVAPALAQKELSIGPARSTVNGHVYSLGDAAIEAKWEIVNGKLAGLKITDQLNHKTIEIPTAFSLLFKDGRVVQAQDMHFTGTPSIHDLKAVPGASRYSDQLGGKEFEGTLEDETGSLSVSYSIVLRDGSAYLRQLFAITAPQTDLAISDVRLIDLQLPDAQVTGTVDGSPIVAGDFYLGFEHPLSTSQANRGHAVADLERKLPLPKGQTIIYSTVVGITPPGQMRRSFLAYIERERAHPYRTFLHYNSWYDAGFFTPYDEATALDRVNAFGTELHTKRGVALDSYLFDDGWDNHSSLWGFNQGFPNGFTPIRDAAAKYRAAPGVWMSPWGGYSKPKQERIAYGTKEGFEIVGGGYALSGPKYYEHFRDTCLEMIRKYGVNQFKFDGTGNVNSVVPGSHFDSDFSAMIHLIGEIRQEKPDMYINLTTGTTASPFWLLYADSIWRGGYDDNVAGVGTNRERWITYRDADTYANIVSRGPLYPLNSLMLHGIIYAQYAKRLHDDPGNDFSNEVRSYFGTGTQLQELYITPSLLTDKNWDTLAEAAKWSRDNESVLKDTHWVGGDPNWLQVYGWASWTPKKSILVLRNPSDRPGSIEIDLAKVLELPAGASLVYTARSPWKADAAVEPLTLNAHVPHAFRLAPFEVLTLDLQPK